MADSIKLRETFLRELIRDIELRLNPPKPKITYEEFRKANGFPVEGNVNDRLSDEDQANAEPNKSAIRYPTFAAGMSSQFYEVLKDYFVTEDHVKLKKLLLNDQTSESPFIFRGNGNQLADAFKQLFDANLIVGCIMVDLERWLAPKFLYLANGTKPRELTEPYLHSLMSEKTRPCKSPILKIEQKEDKFFILPAPATKNSKKMRG